MSITIQVKYAGLARDKTFKSSEMLKVREQTTLNELVNDLTTTYKESFNNTDRYIVVLNHHGCAYQEWEQQILEDGDSILIISNISGG